MLPTLPYQSMRNPIRIVGNSYSSNPGLTFRQHLRRIGGAVEERRAMNSVNCNWAWKCPVASSSPGRAPSREYSVRPLRSPPHAQSVGRARRSHHPSHIVGTNDPGPHTSRDQSIRFPLIDAEGAGWERTEAKHRKADLKDFRRIPVQPPDHDSREACCLCLQRNQISSAIRSPTHASS